jgi:hypothetical protein
MAGLQEYIEAVSFYHYLKQGSLITLSEVEKDLVFARPSADQTATQTPATQDEAQGKEEVECVVSSSDDVSCKGEKGEKGEKMSGERQQSSDQSTSGGNVTDTSGSIVTSGSDSSTTSDKIFVSVPPSEFMLGIADLTGELMRTAIMSVSEGDLDYLVTISNFLRIIHDAFAAYGNTAGRELTRKMFTLRQSLEKVENACYTLKVRGAEIPKHMLVDIFTVTASAVPVFDDMEDAPIMDD